MSINETKQAIQLLMKHTNCIAWTDFSDRGNSCTGRLDRLTTANEITKNAISLSNVKQAMPKYSNIHEKLSQAVASEIGIKWVSYDCLVKTIARILEDDFQTFYHMLSLSIFVKDRMKEKGLAEISSLEDLFRS